LQKNESGAIAAADVIFDNASSPTDIDTLFAKLQGRIEYPCTRVEWVGFTMTIQQIRIGTPTPMFLQIEDDPSFVPAEIKEMAKTAEGALGRRVADQIAKCRSRITVLGPAIDAHLQEKDSIVVVGATRLDPSMPQIEATLKAIADILGGYVYDDVNGKWRYASKNGA